MFRFSCFHAHVPSNKQKKTIVQPSTEAMAKVLQHDFPKQVSDDSIITASSNPSPSKAQVHKQMDVNGGICISEDLDSTFTFENDIQVHQTRHIKKSHSLASGLCREGRQYAGCVTEGDADPGFSCDGSKSHTESPVSVCGEDHDIIPTDQCEKNPNSEFQFSSAHANDGSIFSIGELTLSDKEALQISDTPLSGELAGDSADQTSGPSTPSLMKSHSLPDFNAPVLSTRKSASEHPPSISRSSDDLHALGKRQKEVFINESDDQIKGDQGRENYARKIEESHTDSYFNDGFDSYLTSGSAKDWVMPITDGMRDDKTLQGYSSVDCFGEYPNGDFKIKRVEDWVIGLQHCGPPLEEINELPESVDPLVNVNTKNGVTAAEVDHKNKVTPGMEAAKRYISSLSANATAAHLINHGLVVIPFLSAFVSLKVLNLAGNAIVRITAGALPRGLHVLNLSKNNISTIEGLRDLTRLRVLDLSYNRIVRIGHGLASCSSLKELYLAGNKISEIEGLHRLLKLSILDIRFNKISTAKCLGQLAANYNSLQAISLEGNPAQKNVGDEQLKKNLQGLLPHLVYYNRQPIQVSTLKDGADRSVRLGMSTHQLDRSLRSDRKTATRKISRPSTSSTHARRSQIVEPPKPSKGKQSLLPPPTRTRTQSRYHFEFPSKALDLTSEQLSIRKSRSEGTLGAL